MGTTNWLIRSAAIGWQESLLSMSLGKPPSSIVPGKDDVPLAPVTYPDVMQRLCGRYANLVRAWSLESPSLEHALEQVRLTERYFATLNELLDTSGPAITPVQVCQRKAFRMHTAYALSYLCRPALIYRDGRNSSAMPSSQTALMAICCDNLIAALKQYLELLELTNVAVRSWAMIYNGLGSSLVLGMLGEFQKNSNARALARDLLARRHHFAEQCTDTLQKWQSRAMETLEGMLGNEVPLFQGQPGEGSFAPLSGQTMWENDAAFMLGPELGLLDFGVFDDGVPQFPGGY